jgi:hypothetical protein
MVTLVSFDIDGTLEVGDPPGIVSIALVKTAKRLGYLVGSCSDRPISHQQSLWARLQIAVDFTVLKHELASVKRRFTAAAYYHIGDTDVDDHYATRAGFRFLKADVAGRRLWPVELFADPPDRTHA